MTNNTLKHHSDKPNKHWLLSLVTNFFFLLLSLSSLPSTIQLTKQGKHHLFEKKKRETNNPNNNDNPAFFFHHHHQRINCIKQTARALYIWTLHFCAHVIWKNKKTGVDTIYSHYHYYHLEMISKWTCVKIKFLKKQWSLYQEFFLEMKWDSCGQQQW